MRADEGTKNKGVIKKLEMQDQRIDRNYIDGNNGLPQSIREVSYRERDIQFDSD